MSDFLKQLQESAGLLNNKIKDTDTTQIRNLFGNYDPRSAADYTIGPMGGIAQNRFEGNQFQMPNLFNAEYIPEAFNQGSLLQTPTYNNMGTFTPGAFNQYGNIPVTGNIPSNVSTTTTSDRGGNGPNQQDNQKYSYETFNGKSYRVNNFTGEVEEADLPFGTASLLGGLINQIPGVADYRFENLPLNTQEQINNLVANDPNSLRNAQGINNAVKEVFGVDLNSNLTNEFNQAQGSTTPAGLLNRPVNLNITPQDLSLLGGIPTAPTTATERLNITEAEKIAANQRLAQAQQINEAIKEQNVLGGISVDDYENALNRMTDKQFKSFDRTDAERGITTARSDSSKANQKGSKANNDRQRDRADAGQRGEKAGPRGRGQYGGR